jgi:XTP/dITP diphosphohydrolase
MLATTLLIASRNRHKAAEIHAILGVECLTLETFPDAPYLLEDAPTFAGNAAGKAIQLARWLETSGRLHGIDAKAPDHRAGFQGYILADDSGLEVDALDGAPGVYSARFAQLDGHGSGNASDTDNNAKLLRLLEPVPWEKRTARFRCLLALLPVPPPAPGFEPHLFEGVCEGRIGFAPTGRGGFGYDPLFIPTGLEQTFAELGEGVKNRISHRAQALERLRQWLTGAKRLFENSLSAPQGCSGGLPSLP